MLHRLYVILVGMSLVVTVGAMVFGKLGLRILFGKEILQYYNLFMPIVWCTILTAIIWVLSAILVALRKMNVLLIGMVIDFGLCVGMVRPLIVGYEKNGISLVQIISYGIYIIFMVIACEIILYRLRRKDKEL